MALIDRVTRMFRADLHAVMDRIEEPQVLLRQALREMEEELERGRASLKAAQVEREHLERRIGEIDTLLRSLAGELDLCFAAGNEALVRTLLRRRLESERVQQALRQRVADGARRSAALQAQQAERQRELEQLRQRMALFPDAGSGEARREDDFTVSEADVDLALLREREARRAS